MQSLSIPSSTAEMTLDPLEASLNQSQEPNAESIAEASTAASTKEITKAILTEAVLLQPTATTDAIPEEASAWKLHLKVFTSTFLTIFLAELGDKTQVTTLLMAAESHSPWTVFAGAGAALVATSAIGVCLGCWLAKRISPQMLQRSVGVLLLGVSLLMMWDVILG